MTPLAKIAGWTIDEEDPRSPPQELWDAMTPEQRDAVIDALPTEFEVTEDTAPEGDFHDDETSRLKRGLRRFFGGGDGPTRRVYVGGNLPVYYPNETMFAPDLIAVVDVEPHLRSSWNVSREGKGLDFALEVLWSGKRRKDLVTNVERLARLGVPDYFVFDMPRTRLHGYRLEGATYVPVVPHAGCFTTSVLGLRLGVEEGKVRFFNSTARIPDESELLARFGATLDESVALVAELEARLAESDRQREAEQRLREEEQRRREEEQRRREEEQRLREEEQRRREQLEAQLAEALARLEQLDRKG